MWNVRKRSETLTAQPVLQISLLQGIFKSKGSVLCKTDPDDCTEPYLRLMGVPEPPQPG